MQPGSGELCILAEGHNLEDAFLTAIAGIGHSQIEPADRQVLSALALDLAAELAGEGDCINV